MILFIFVGPKARDRAYSWYQGKVFFSDSIETINTKTLESKTVLDLQSESGGAIDATNLKLSSDENYLLFMNKRDLSLWGLRI